MKRTMFTAQLAILTEKQGLTDCLDIMSLVAEAKPGTGRRAEAVHKGSMPHDVKACSTGGMRLVIQDPELATTLHDTKPTATGFDLQ